MTQPQTPRGPALPSWAPEGATWSNPALGGAAPAQVPAQIPAQIPAQVPLQPMPAGYPPTSYLPPPPHRSNTGKIVAIAVLAVVLVVALIAGVGGLIVYKAVKHTQADRYTVRLPATLLGEPHTGNNEQFYRARTSSLDKNATIAGYGSTSSGVVVITAVGYFGDPQRSMQEVLRGFAVGGSSFGNPLSHPVPIRTLNGVVGQCDTFTLGRRAEICATVDTYSLVITVDLSPAAQKHGPTRTLAIRRTVLVPKKVS